MRNRNGYLLTHLKLDDIFLFTWRPYVWIMACGFLLYGNTLFFIEYTHQDDYLLIVQSFPFISDLSNIGRAFQEDVFHLHQGGVFYRPILTISLMIDAQLGGTAPFVYRVSNILFHVVATDLLFLVLQGVGLSRKYSFFLSLLFCLHPGVTQAVAWIPGRNDSLLAIFVLGSFLALLTFRFTIRFKWFSLHMLLFALALFTKESAVALVPLCLFWVWRMIPNGRRLRLSILLLAGWFAIVLNWFVLRQSAMILQISDISHPVKNALEYFWISIPFVGTFFWPDDVFVIALTEDLRIFPGVAGLLFLSVIAGLATRRNWNLMFFGLMWFVFFLLPGFYHQGSETIPINVYEHRAYVPFVGMMFVLSSLSFAERFNIQKIPLIIQKIPLVGAVGLLVVLSYLSFRHSGTFENAMTFSEHAARTSPRRHETRNDIRRMHLEEHWFLAVNGNDTSHSENYSRLYKLQNLLQEKVKRSPEDIESRHQLAIVYFGLGWLVSAQEEFARLLSRDPRNFSGHFNFGVLSYTGHRRDVTEREWLEAVRLNPSFAKAHHNLAYLYYETEQYPLALQHFDLAERNGMKVNAGLVKEIRFRAQLEGN